MSPEGEVAKIDLTVALASHSATGGLYIPVEAEVEALT
jgi:hypothetical protein